MLDISMQLQGNLEKYVNNLTKQPNMVQVGYFENQELNKIATTLEYGGTVDISKEIKYWYAWLKQNTGLKNIPYPTIKTIRIPPRPFMHLTFNKNNKNWIDAIKEFLKTNSIEDTLQKVGELIQQHIIDSIESDIQPSNLPIWRLYKQYRYGANTTLMATGKLSSLDNIKIIVGNE